MKDTHCQSRVGARHGICELVARHGRGTAWARHAMCESALRSCDWFLKLYVMYQLLIIKLFGFVFSHSIKEFFTFVFIPCFRKRMQSIFWA